MHFSLKDQERAAIGGDSPSVPRIARLVLHPKDSAESVKGSVHWGPGVLYSTFHPSGDVDQVLDPLA